MDPPGITPPTDLVKPPDNRPRQQYVPHIRIVSLPRVVKTHHARYNQRVKQTLLPGAQTRAVALAVIIAIQGWMALPIPHKVTVHSLKSPEAHEELTRWMGVIHDVGIDRSRAEVAADLEYWTSTIHKTWSTVSKPTAPIRKLLGVHQRWALFASPDTYPTILVVSVHDGNSWTEVYRRLDPGKDFMRDELGFRRVRGVHDGVGQQANPAWLRMADWIVARALTEYPEAKRGRVQAVQMHSVAPPKPPDTSQRVLFRAIRTRRDLGL